MTDDEQELPAFPIWSYQIIPDPNQPQVVALAFETALLFFPADVQKKFEDGDAVAVQHLFELIDLAETPFCHLVGDEFVHARHQHILVMGAIEDADGAETRHRSVDAPQVVVADLCSDGRLERDDAATLWVDAGQNASSYLVRFWNAKLDGKITFRCLGCPASDPSDCLTRLVWAKALKTALLRTIGRSTVEIDEG